MNLVNVSKAFPVLLGGVHPFQNLSNDRLYCVGRDEFFESGYSRCIEGFRLQRRRVVHHHFVDAIGGGIEQFTNLAMETRQLLRA